MENKTMKNILKATTLACLMATAFAHADIPESSTLSVTGTLHPASCTPSLANNGVVDLGDYQAEKMTETANQLTYQTIELSVTCANPKKLSLHMQDSNAEGHLLTPIKQAFADDGDNEDPLHQFGLGKDAEGKPIGAYGVIIAGSPLVNKDLADVIFSAGGTWGASKSHAFTNGSGVNALLSVAAPGETIPMAIETMQLTLRINAAVAANTAVNMKEKINFDGKTTLVMSYL